MNLRDLDYFVAVATYNNFGRAAESVNVSQPALSMQVKKLEETLGVSLFERHSRKVLLTPVGGELLPIAREVQHLCRHFKERARQAQNPFVGELMVASIPTIGPYLFSTLVARLGESLPDLKLLLVEEKAASILARLKDGVLDVAIMTLPVDEAGLEQVPLYEEPFYLAVPEGHRLAGNDAVRHDDMKGELLLLLDEGHCLRDHALEVCEQVSLAVRRDFQTTSLETLRLMVARGAGVTLMPEMARRSGDGLVYLPFADYTPTRQIGMVWRKSTVRRPVLDALHQEMMRLIS